MAIPFLSDISGKSATFAGSITTNLSSEGTYFTGGSGGIRQLSITSGTNTSAHALHTFNIASSNGKYEFDVNGTTELSLDSSIATFAGNVLVGGATQFSSSALCVDSSTTNVVATFKSTDNQAWIAVMDDDSGTYGALLGTDTDAGQEIVFANNAATKRFWIDTSGNATFAGNVNAGTGLRMYTDGSGNGVIYNLGQDKDLYFVGDDGGTGINALVLDMSDGGAATFAGAVTVEGGTLELGKADTASGHINAKELMTFNIDTDNDDTNRYFAWYKNSSSGSGTELLKILESGNATFAGTIGATNFSGSSSGTNTGDQTLPTASSLGAVTLTGTQTISGAKTFSSNNNHYKGHLYYDAYDANGNHYPHYNDGSNGNGANINIRHYYGTSYKTHVMSSDSSGNMQFDFQGTYKGDALDIDGNAVISGNLTVNGTTTTLNTQTVEVEDNILQLNTTQGSPDTATAATSGVSIYRGDGVTQASLIFDDADDTWDLTNNLKIAGSLNVGPGPSRFTDQQNAGSRLELYNDRQDAGNVEVFRIAAYNAAEVTGVHFYRGSGGSSGYTKIFAKKNNTSSLEEVVQFGTNDALTTTFAGAITTTGTLTVNSGHVNLDAGMSLSWDNTHERIEQSDGHLEFFINNGEAMTLDTDGLGIGTTDPTSRLSLSGQQSLLDLTRATSGDAKFFVSADSARLYFSHTDIQSTNLILKLDASDESATFAGDITVTGGDITIGTDSIAGNINSVGDVLALNVDSNTGGGAGANIQLKTAGTAQLTVTSSSATFAGNVELKSDAGNATKHLRIWNQGTAANDDAVLSFTTQSSRTYSIGTHRDSGAFLLTNADASVASGELLTIDNSGNATFTGYVAATQFRPTNIVTNKVVKFNGTQLDDSIITDDGSTVSVAGEVNMASGKITSDGSAAAGAYLELKHANNNSTDVCATINLTNNAGGYAAIVGGTTGANNSGYIQFKTDNAGTQSTVLTLNHDNKSVFNGNVEITGDTASPHSDNAFLVLRGSDGSNAFRVQNSGEVVVQNNYLYAAGAGTSLYVQAGAIIRGDISNDGGDVRIADNLVVTGDLTVKNALIDNASVTSATATTVVASVAHATYNAAFFDFVIKNGTNVRAGTVYACHNGASTPLVEFAETSTVDLGDTSDVTLNVVISGTNMVLQATTTSSTWTIKALIRGI